MIQVKFNGSNTFIDAKFRRTTDNIITLTGNIPQNVNGFKAYSSGFLLGNYSDFNTIYKVLDDGVMFSNDGSVEPKKQIEIKAIWNGGEAYVPDSITITTTKGTDTLKASNWSKTYTIAESEELSLVDGQDVDNFIKVINGNQLEYTYSPVSPVPSMTERIADLEEAVCELYERVGE